MQLNSVYSLNKALRLSQNCKHFVAGFLGLLLLGGCATPPQPSSEQQTQTAISAASKAHQDDLAKIEHWRLEGQLALFDLTADERNAVYVSWQHSPEQTAIRLSHPLKGTLARVNATPTSAELIREDEERIYAPTLAALFRYHLRLPLPVALIQQTVLGRLPEQSREVQFYHSDEDSNGTLAGFEVIAAQANWQVTLSRYEAVALMLADETQKQVQLPTMIELESAEYRIKLRVSQWSQAQ